MRLARYVAAEVAVVLGAAALLGAGGGYGARVIARWRAAPAPPPALAAVPARVDLAAPPEPALAAEPAGTFLGMSDDLLLERLRTQPIERLKVNKGGSSLSFRMDFADGSRAAFKPAQTNLQTMPRKEVAAYRLNRLLGLNAVPPAAPRLVSREEIFGRLHPDSAAAAPRIRAETIFNPQGKTAGAVSYWIPVIKDSGFDTPEGRERAAAWLTVGAPVPPEARAMAAQLAQLVVFDFLTANPDRHSGGNMKVSEDGLRLFFMDNTMAFFLAPDGTEKNRASLLRTQRFSRRLHAALDRLDERHIERALAETGAAPHDLLTPAEIRAVVARRDVIKRHVEALIARHGAAEVLFFP